MTKVHLRDENTQKPVCNVQNARRIGTSLNIVEDVQYVTCERCLGPDYRTMKGAK